MAGMVTYRRMRMADLPAADGLRSLAGWNQTTQTVANFISLNPDGCFVAELGEQLAGTVTTTPFGQDFGWIGMMLVHPDYRRKGIATELMRLAMAHLQGRGLRSIGLDATPAGLPVYERLGFRSVSTLTRWQRAARPDPAGQVDEGVRALEDSDWPAVLQLYRSVSGSDRGELLRLFHSHSQRALVCDGIGPVEAWGLCKKGVRANHIGPIQGTFAASQRLFECLVRTEGSSPLYCDVPDQNLFAVDLVMQAGFERMRPLTRMYLGSPQPRQTGLEFCILDPATS